jgi:uncharacterized membrane protein (DUF2068 family)
MTKKPAPGVDRAQSHGRLDMPPRRIAIEVGMDQAPAKIVSAEQPHKWLVVIGVLKLLKAVCFVLLGIGALRLLHHDLVDMVSRWIVTDLRFDPESHFVNLVLSSIADISPHRLKLISLGIFGYAVLDVIEGTGLVLEKAWAEYVTLTITACFLPLEFFELFRHITLVKVVLILLNVLLVFYLLWVVQGQARRRAHSAALPNSRL